MSPRFSVPSRRLLPALLLLGAMLLLAAGCDRAPRQEAINVESASEESHEFSLATAYAEQYEGQLAATLEFTRPLASTQDFDRLIQIFDAEGAPVSGSWTLDDSAVLLRFPFIVADATYQVKIRAGLTASDGETLSADISHELYTGPLKPSVAFASQGSVLPARQTRGLPVVAVNVREVDVEFMRVRDSEVANFFATYQTAGQRSSWDLDSSNWYDRSRKGLTEVSDSVYANRFVLDSKPNRSTVSYLPIQNITELAPAGLYFAVMRRAGSFEDQYATSFFFVSDVGVHTRAYKDQLLIHTASLKSGGALAAVQLSILDSKGQPVLQGSTDNKGNALLDYQLDAAHVLVARSGKDVSLMPFNQHALDLSDFAVGGRKQQPFDVFAWSGRDLYRPGEQLRLSALLRDPDGRMIAPQPLFVRLKQPDGRLFTEAQLAPQAQNYYAWELDIPDDAATGRWQVEFRLDPASKQTLQSLSMRIEDFLPERLKLQLESPQKLLHPGDELQVDIQSDYLYGAPAANNRVTARLGLTAALHLLEDRTDFYFGDPTIVLPDTPDDVIDARLDEDGYLHSELEIDAAAGDVGAPVTITLTASVHETGGRSVSRVLKRTIWPADALVGVRPLFSMSDGAPANGRAGFEVIRSTADGSQPGAGQLQAQLVRERRDYYWSYNASHGWRFDYRARFQPVEDTSIVVEPGKPAQISFPVEWGNYRLEITDPATGLRTRLPFHAGWSLDDDNRGIEARPDKVKLALDKESYRAGDTVTLTVTPPHSGPGVLFVETDKLLYARNIDARPGATFEIPVDEDWERHDVYISAIVLRGGSALEKITPARAVGAVFVPMDRHERQIDVTIKAPALMKPQTDLDVAISAPQLAGKQAHATVTAVDLGILNITGFETPDPFAWFFGQRALGVDARDVYSRVIESFDGAAARLRYGGDMMTDALPVARRPNALVQTIDLFSGPVTLDGAGSARIALPMPDFNGTVRVSAVVYADDAYGSADTQSVVRAPLLAEVSTPRVLAPGDQSQITVDLHNFSGQAQDIDVELTADGPLQVHGQKRRIHLDDDGRTTLQFPLVAQAGLGVGTIRLTADSVGTPAEPIVVRRSFELNVRPPWGEVLRSTVRVLDPLAPVRVDSADMAGLLPESVRARMTVGALPPLPFGEALRGLLDFPYGGSEQLASKGWAALLLDAPTAKLLDVEAIDSAQRNQRVNQAIARVLAMQNGSGGFAMWSGDPTGDPMLTPYITNFLLDARDAGFRVPNEGLQKSLERLHEDLLGSGPGFYGDEHRDHLRLAYKAYAGYVLARLNRAPLGSLRTLFDNGIGDALTALPLVHLGVALHLMGDEARGNEAIQRAFALDMPRPRWLGDYGSQLRDEALIVTLLHRHGLQQPSWDERIFSVARQLQSQRDGRRSQPLWLSTQEQVAIARLGKTLLDGDAATLSGVLQIGTARADVAPTPLFSHMLDSDGLAAGVVFRPEGTPPLYASIDVAGVPTRAPAENDELLRVRRQFYTLDGKPWEPATLREGDVLIAGVEIETSQDMPNAVLEDLLPAGLEVENMNLADPEQWSDLSVNGVKLDERRWEADVAHEEYRSDRYIAMLRLSSGATAKLFYLVRAVSPGSFQVPPPQVHDMYLPQLRGVGRAVPDAIRIEQP